MKNLYIDPSGGIAGDMIVSALISLGANKDKVISAMTFAANKIGEATIKINTCSDNSTQLIIDLKANNNHVDADIALKLLNELFIDLKIEKAYQEFGKKALDILISAEGKAHRENIFLTDMKHNHNNKTYLHEAQDIIIDIIGAVVGLQDLKINTNVKLISPVSVGDGNITFSHGTLPVPSPATEIVLNEFNIPWKKGPINTELCTPTGASIIAALNAEMIEKDIENLNIGTSRGGKILNIPPLKFYI